MNIVKTFVQWLVSEAYRFEGSRYRYHFQMDHHLPDGNRSASYELWEESRKRLGESGFVLVKARGALAPRERDVELFQNQKKQKVLVELCMDYGFAISSMHVDVSEFVRQD